MRILLPRITFRYAGGALEPKMIRNQLLRQPFEFLVIPEIVLNGFHD